MISNKQMLAINVGNRTQNCVGFFDHSRSSSKSWPRSYANSIHGCLIVISSKSYPPAPVLSCSQQFCNHVVPVFGKLSTTTSVGRSLYVSPIRLDSGDMCGITTYGFVPQWGHLRLSADILEVLILDLVARYCWMDGGLLKNLTNVSTMMAGEGSL